MLPAADCQSGGSAVISTDLWKWRLRRQEALHFLNTAVCSASAKKTGAGTWIHNYVHEQKFWFAETFCPKMIKQLLDGCWWPSAEWPGEKKGFYDCVCVCVFVCVTHSCSHKGDIGVQSSWWNVGSLFMCVYMCVCVCWTECIFVCGRPVMIIMV